MAENWPLLWMATLFTVTREPKFMACGIKTKESVKLETVTLYSKIFGSKESERLESDKASDRSLASELRALVVISL
jgi:hypothetical protein